MVKNNRKAMSNLRGLKLRRLALGLTASELAKATRISKDSIVEYENGTRVPKAGTYNALAEALGWKDLVDVPLPEPEQNMVLKPEFTFQEGGVYEIDGFQFTYIGKKGIHHHFKAVPVGWLRTYTDAQLVGKKITEVV